MVNAMTLPGYSTEVAAADDFDATMAQHAHGMIKAYPECRGQCLSSFFGSVQQQPRIDRILVPQPPLIAAGFPRVFLGAEIKKSDVKIGRPLAQCQDYRRAAFSLPGSFSGLVLDAIFLWPFRMCVGDFESIMAQNRIGGISRSTRDSMDFFLGGRCVLRLINGKVVDVDSHYFQNVGRKVGSR